MTDLSFPDLVMHPVRLRILGTLANRQLTTRQILKTLPDLSQATIYRHVQMLAEAGLLKVVEEKPVRGVIERVYTVVPEEAIVQTRKMPRYTREDMIRYFRIFIDSVITQFRLYSSTEDADPVKDGVGFWGDTAYLTLEERQEVIAEIQALVRRRRENPPTPDRLRYHLCHEIFPDKTRLDDQNSD